MYCPVTNEKGKIILNKCIVSNCEIERYKIFIQMDKEIQVTQPT